LAGKAAASHFHATSDVTGLDAALAGKASSSHTHSTSDVSGFSEAVDDRVASLLVAGTNITITYDDASNTLTVSSTGGGGIGGSTGGNDNRLLRSDGTGGATVQSSGITIDDSNNVSGVGTFAAGAGTFAGIVTVGTGSGVSTIYANSGLASSNTRQLAVRPSDDTSTNAMTLDIYPGSTSTILPSLRMFSSPVTGTTYALQFGTGPATLAAGFWHIGSTVVGDSTADSLPISFLVSNETDGRFSPLVLQINGVCTPVRGVHWESELTGTPTGTTRTINLNLANHQTLQLTSATGTVTVTLTVPFYNSASGTIIIRQHGTTPRGISWAVSSGSIKWLGSQPTWGSDAVNSYRIVSWRWNGSILFLASTDSGT
jgi:hypothetical protein